MQLPPIIETYFAGDLKPLRACRPGDFPKCPELAGTRVGAILRAFRARSALAVGFNRLLGARRVEAEGDVIVIAEEAQCQSYWGILRSRLHEHSPPVLRCANEEPVVWEPEFDTLDAFLSAFCLWQAVNGAWPFLGRCARPLSPITQQTDYLTRVPIDGPRSGLSFYHHGRALVVAASQTEWYAAARHEAVWRDFLGHVQGVEEWHA